jgi:hypothetical protein
MRWMSRIAILLITAAPFAAGAESAFVEGRVFNKRSGAPLENARVSVLSGEVGITATIGSEPFEVPLGHSITDGNGFYSIEIDLADVPEIARAYSSVRAECAIGDQTKSSPAQTHPVRFRPETIHRDLYVGGLGRGTSRCTYPTQRDRSP